MRIPFTRRGGTVEKLQANYDALMVEIDARKTEPDFPQGRMLDQAWSFVEEAILCAATYGGSMSEEVSDRLHRLSYAASYLYLILEVESPKRNAVRIVQAFALFSGSQDYLAHVGTHEGRAVEMQQIEHVPTLMDFAIWAAGKAGMSGIAGAAVEAVTALQYLTDQLHGSLPGDHELEHQIMHDIEAEMAPISTWTSVRQMDRHKQEMDARNSERALGRHGGGAYLSAANSFCVAATAARASRRDVVYVAASPEDGGSAIRYDHRTGLVDHLALPRLTYAAVTAIRAELAEIFGADDGGMPLAEAERRLHRVLQRTGEAVVAPIFEAWPDSARLSLVPLHRVIDLPLPASYVDGKPALLHRDITITPNARCLLLAALREPPPQQGSSVFVACDPSEGPDYIGEVIAEAERIARLYGVTPHVVQRGNGFGTTGSSARLRCGTRVGLHPNSFDSSPLDEICGADVVHLACHGYVEDAPFYESTLDLGGAISMNDLLKRGVTAGSIFILSACYVGGVVPSYPSELLGFPASLLSAGARSVLASLWPVPDASSTIDLVERFHLGLKAGATASVAYREAVDRAIADGIDALTWGGFAVYGP
jgi:hypothetical protein